MKKFNKDQLTFFGAAALVVLLLIFKTVGHLEFGLGNKNEQMIKASVDSVLVLEGRINSLHNDSLLTKRDLFNAKDSKKKIVAVVDTSAVKVVRPKVVKKNYTYKLTIEPASDLEVLTTGDGIARINVGGAARQISVGDQVPCAVGVEVEYDEATGEKTGNVKKVGSKMGTVVSIDKRNIFFSVAGADQGVRLNSREGAKLIDVDFLPKKGASSTPAKEESSGSGTKVKRQR